MRTKMRLASGMQDTRNAAFYRLSRESLEAGLGGVSNPAYDAVEARDTT